MKVGNGDRPLAAEVVGPYRDPRGPSAGEAVVDAGERAVLRLLASGLLGQVAGVLADRGRHDLVALVAETDARTRGVLIDVAEVQAVVARVEAEEPPDSRLRFWSQAVLAERLLLDHDASAFLVAEQALAELERCPLPVLPPLALRYARARLARVASGSWLALPDPERAEGCRARRDQALSELLACGLTGEVHLTRGLTAGLMAVTADIDIVENYALLRDARAALRHDSASIWPGVLDGFVGIAAFEVGDFTAAIEAFDRIEQSTVPHPRVRVISAYGQAFFRLVIGGASPQSVSGVEQALAEVRRHEPRIAQGWHGHLAHTLADLGSRWAGHFARLEADLPATGPAHALQREILGWRVAALDGLAVRAEEAIATAERLEALGLCRRAGRLALRLAHDLARAGSMAAARQLQDWGRGRIPPGDRATFWEQWWLRPLDDRPKLSVPRAPLAIAGLPPGRAVARRSRRAQPGGLVEVMGPAVEVRLEGVPVTPGEAQTKLLAALALTHPAPFHVERASDLLWPEEPLTATRSRLNSMIHRLRRVLGAHGAAVVRTGDLLQLDPDRCDVDLWRFRRSLADDARERARALRSVTGNLCEAQFPYDDLFIEERHHFAGEWLRRAREAVRAGEIGPAELSDALLALGLDPAELS